MAGLDGADAPSAEELSALFAALEVDGARQSTRKPRVNWTDEETRALKSALAKHRGAVYVWASIKADPEFSVTLGRRSNLDLQRKGRSLLRSESVAFTSAGGGAETPDRPSDGARTPTRSTEGCAAHTATPRRSWTPTEVDALTEGLQRHGPGNWMAIKSDATLADALRERSNIQLSDKYRSMRKAAAAREAKAADSAARQPSGDDSANSNVKCETPVAIELAVLAGAANTERASMLAAMIASPPPPPPPRLTRPLSTIATASERNAAEATQARTPQRPLTDEKASQCAAEGSSELTGVDLHALPRARRYLGYVPALVSETGGGRMSTAAVREWLFRHPEECPVAAHELCRYQIDHIISHKLGGHDHPFNYFLLEGGANSRFSHYVSAEKERVVGRAVWRIATAFAAYCRSRVVAANINYNDFDVVQHMQS